MHATDRSSFTLVALVSALSWLSASASSSSSSAFGGDASSTGLAPAEPEPTHGYWHYMAVSAGVQAVICLLLLLLFMHFPLHLTLKLGCTLYGFEPVITLYQTQNKDRADIKIQGLDAGAIAAAAGTTTAPTASDEADEADEADHVGEHSVNSSLARPTRAVPKRRTVSPASASTADASTHLLSAAAAHSDDSAASGRTTLRLSHADRQSTPISPTMEQLMREQNKPLLNMYLHSRTNSLWIMGRTFDFNAPAVDEEDRAEEERVRAAAEEGEDDDDGCRWGSRVSDGADYFHRCACVHRGCCRGRLMGRSSRIRRLLKHMLFLQTYIALTLLIGLALMASKVYQLSDGSHQCPADVGNESWDCFLFSWSLTVGPRFVDCTHPIPADIDTQQLRSLVCFKYVTLDAETYLQAVSTIASLFTLVFGGAGTLFGWLLSNMSTRRHVRWAYVFPVGLLLLWLVFVSVGWLHSALALMAPLAVALLAVDLIKIRLAVGFDHDQPAQRPSTSPQPSLGNGEEDRCNDDETFAYRALQLPHHAPDHDAPHTSYASTSASERHTVSRGSADTALSPLSVQKQA